MFIAYLEFLSKNKGRYDTSSLRSGFIAGSGCPEALMYRIINEMNIKEFTTGYG
jgi:fatty-acyl-CoA synthase